MIALAEASEESRRKARRRRLNPLPRRSMLSRAMERACILRLNSMKIS